MKTDKEMFINVSAGGTRIAVTENQKLVELHIERADYERMVGNIYKGKVQNVIPGMQAAFIDIGYESNAFLPFSEIGSPENLSNLSFDDDDDEIPSKNKNTTKRNFNPEKDLSKGDDILVQVIKEPFSGKGPRVTTEVSIPGSLMVLVPNGNYIGISRKISDKYEKRRLRRTVKDFKPENFGLIVRTIAQGKEVSLLEADFNRVWSKWKELDQKIKKKKAPATVFRDFTTSDQVIRDLFTPQVKRLIVDDKALYKRFSTYIKDVSPEQLKNLELMKGKGTIFNQDKIEEQIEKSLKRKVWMKSGAHIVIEHTEAMVVIDVNSGRYIGKKDHESNSLRINLESAREIARQLRLRDIGGLIVIDFIDLQDNANRKKVYNELRSTLLKDRAKVSLTEFSNFGLLEMTRQRIGLNLLHTVSVECPTCSGLGRIESHETTLTRLENWLKRFRVKAKDKRLRITLNPDMVDYINETKSKVISGFMWENWMLIEIQKDPHLPPHKFNVYSKKRREDVTDEV
ncbi:MAG: Rne/Rng family ribonuclease [Candidatus Marinimicrobia bacterium]|nr:Rne/Rng family ribonuclease [Candidatus Neomarinimicrobiota bacterium]